MQCLLYKSHFRARELYIQVGKEGCPLVFDRLPPFLIEALRFSSYVDGPGPTQWLHPRDGLSSSMKPVKLHLKFI
jgi:hypothetical protein